MSKFCYKYIKFIVRTSYCSDVVSGKMFKLMCFLLIVHTQLTSTLYSPVLIWGAKCPSKPALRTIEISEFAAIVRTLLEDHMLVVLQEDHLASQDFLCRKANTTNSCYNFLQSVTPKTYYANVQEPIVALSMQVDNVQMQTVREYNCLYCKAACAVGTIQLLNFEPDETVPREVELEMHDKFVRRLQHANNAACPTAYMYLAANAALIANPSEHMPLLQHARVRRESDDSALSDKRVLFQCKQILIKDTLSKDTKELTVSSIATTEEKDEIEAKVVTSGGDVTLLIETTKSAYSVKKIKHDSDEFNVHQLSAPMKYSYACKSLTAYAKDKTLTIELLQLQVFPEESTSKEFSGIWDCEGSVSSDLIMGYFSIAILLGILFFAVCMFMDIKSNDKMDDEHGPRLIINVH